MARRGYVVCGVLLVACSSSERIDKRVSTTHAAHATLDLLRTYPDLAPRASGLGLSRAADGWHADLDPAPPSQTGPRWIDTRDLQTGFHATLPTRAGQPLHVGVSDTIWIDITAEGDAPVEAQHIEGALVYAGARADHDVVLTAQKRHLEELRVLRSPASGSSLKYRVKLGPGVSQLRVREGVVEVLDHAGTARLRSDPWFALDARHRRIDIVPTLEGEGTDRVLSAKLTLEGAAYPVAIDPGWGSPVSMAIPRRYHQATVLASGKVLVTGGEVTSGTDITSSAELFDPATRTWTVVKAMTKPRTHHGTVLLASGKVLAIGNFYGSDCSIGSGSELYDPATDTWTAGPFMSTPRGDAGVEVLSSGKVFVGGGRTCGGTFSDPSNTADVYDPGTNTWKAVTNNMSAQHSTPAAQPFGTDKAILGGGWPGYGTTSNAEIYDAATNTFTSAPKMSRDRGSLMSTTLADGRVLVIGGTYYASSYYGLSTVDTFVPAGGIFSVGAVPAMPTNRQLGGAVRLSTGKVLVAFGGDGYPSYTNGTMSVLYDPGTNTWK
ncbi:MAG: Kelch repeat-containing protein, partial [Polyangiales bacterium]